MYNRPEIDTGKLSNTATVDRKLAATRMGLSRSAPLLIVGQSDIGNLGLRQVLVRNSFRNVSQAPTLQDAKLATPGKPQLILIMEPAVEAGLPETVSAVRAYNEAARIVVFVDTSSRVGIEAAMQISAHAFLGQRIECQALVSALDVVLGNGSVLSTDFVSCLVSRSSDTTVRPASGDGSIPAPLQSWPLSNREVDILKCLTDGASNKLIARQFAIAESTVKIHVKGILRKINVQNRTQAAIWALAHAPWRNTALHAS